MSGLHPFKRTQQWAVFSRLWYLYDAKWQNPFASAEKITKFLTGRHKPIYHPLSDCGDHVVVINAREIALSEYEWLNRVYFHHTGYPGGASWTLAWELHEKHPTMVLWKAVYKDLGRNLLRPNCIQRLHCFADEVATLVLLDVPPELMQNVCDQIRQIRVNPKRLTEYNTEEIKKYPKVFDWPKDYVIR